MQRYWYLCSIKDIASNNLLTESKVKMILLRGRNDLKKRLEQEGIVI
jgi:RNA polymerase sigma-70 factor (ECF subfamily)